MKQLFFFILLTYSAAAQNDCAAALVVCGDTNFNNIAVNGPGAVQEVSSCGGEEFNSIWMKLNIAVSGTLEFTLIPQSADIGEDFDFYLYSYVSCVDRNIVRCSTTNPASAALPNNLTGLTSSETDVSEGPGPDGNSFVSSLEVLAGETYMLVVDRAFGSSNFSVIWTGTAQFNQSPQFQLPPGATMDISQCDLDGIPDSSTAFDLTENDPLIIGTQTDVVVNYYTTESDALLDVNAIPTPNAFINTTDPQIVYVRIENTVTECFNISEFEISISSEVHLDATEASTCDDNTDGNEFNGQATFNMNDVTAVVYPNFTNPGITVNYYGSQFDADNNNNPLPQFFYNTVPNLQTVFIKVINGICTTTKPIDLIVNSFTPLTDANLVQCDFGASQDGITLFNLAEANMLFTNSNPDLSVAYFENSASVTTNTPLTANYTNTTNPQAIIAKVTNSLTACSILYSLTLNVNTTPGPLLTGLDECDINENGIALFDLTEANVILTPLQTAAYYPSLQDALLEQNAILNTTTYNNPTAYNSSVFVRIDDAINGCSGISEITLTVNRLPVIEVAAPAYLCINQPGYVVPIDAGLLDSQPYSFAWYYESTLLPYTTYSINAVQTGAYFVDVINAAGCKKTHTVHVLPSDIPAIETVITVGSDLYNNSATINLTPTSTGTYGFSIDNPDGPFQTGNVFTTVACGIHTAYATDYSGCGIASQTFEVIGIPVYFSPNGDGYEDTWNLRCASAHPGITIQLFDRFGKLLKQIGVNGTGWDGTINGRVLPADDYWYLVKYEDGRIVSGHFALKR